MLVYIAGWHSALTWGMVEYEANNRVNRFGLLLNFLVRVHRVRSMRTEQRDPGVVLRCLRAVAGRLWSRYGRLKIKRKPGQPRRQPSALE